RPHFRFDVARGARRSGRLFSGIGKAAWSILNRGLRTCFSAASAVGMWATPLGVVQAQRHVHSAIGSGLAAGFTGSRQAFPVEVNPVGVMDQAVEDSVGVGGVADQCVPLIDGDLAGDDGGAVAVTVLEDPQEVVAGRRGPRARGPSAGGEESD